jgi:hypothetical protein
LVVKLYRLSQVGLVVDQRQRPPHAEMRPGDSAYSFFQMLSSESTLFCQDHFYEDQEQRNTGHHL